MSQDPEALLQAVRNERDLSVFDINSIEELTDDDVQLIFDVAKQAKENGNHKYTLLRGTTIFNAFFENSTRTRASFELAGKQLGSETINITSGGSSVKKGETLHDSAQTLSSLRANALVVRTEFAGIPDFLSRHVPSCILNAGDGMHEHPSQALLDVFTMLEHVKSLEKKKILVVGDISHSRVFGSLVRLLPRFGATVMVAAPQTFIRIGFREAFPDVEVYLNVEEALPKADIVMALRVQEERGGSSCLPTLREFSKVYGINERRFAMAKKGALLMHPGPVMRDIEVHNSLMTHADNKILNQVENGLAIRLAMLWLLIRRCDGKKKPYTPV